jgi:hypothetical protein
VASESSQPSQDGRGAEPFDLLAQIVGPVSVRAHGGSRYYALDFALVDTEHASA